MRDFIVVAAVVALAVVPGCSSSPSCTIPIGFPLTTEVSGVASSANTCPAAVVTGFEDLTGSTMTVEDAQSCHDLLFVFTDQSTNASCTAQGSVTFGDFEPNAGGTNEGSGDGTFDISCTDGTSCTEVVTVTVTDSQ